MDNRVVCESWPPYGNKPPPLRLVCLPWDEMEEEAVYFLTKTAPMDSDSVFRADIGFYMRILLGPLLKALCKVHVLLAYLIILAAACMIGRGHLVKRLNK